MSGEIKNLRIKAERIEQEAVGKFNAQMNMVLDLLDYANIERIWLERSEREIREGRRKTIKSAVVLHVVRQSVSSTAYKHTADHLSESEREATGLVFALAGYLAHEVHQKLSFMLLDSLESIDAERIAGHVEYLNDYTGYLLVALLPEDAAALPDMHERGTKIDIGRPVGSNN